MRICKTTISAKLPWNVLDDTLGFISQPGKVEAKLTEAITEFLNLPHLDGIHSTSLKKTSPKFIAEVSVGMIRILNSLGQNICLTSFKGCHFIHWEAGGRRGVSKGALSLLCEQNRLFC